MFVMHGLSCSMPHGIIPHEGLNLCPLHRQLDSQPGDHQGSPITAYLDASVCQHFHPQVLASHCPQEALSTRRAAPAFLCALLAPVFPSPVHPSYQVSRYIYPSVSWTLGYPTVPSHLVCLRQRLISFP